MFLHRQDYPSTVPTNLLNKLQELKPLFKEPKRFGRSLLCDYTVLTLATVPPTLQALLTPDLNEIFFETQLFYLKGINELLIEVCFLI